MKAKNKIDTARTIRYLAAGRMLTARKGERQATNVKLYYHKTDGGAEYLTDKYARNPDGSKEGIFDGARFIVRFQGDITKDAELTVRTDARKGLKL